MLTLKKYIVFPVAVVGIFAVICFSFFQFMYPYHLFYKEQILLFLYTPDYFLSYLEKPAWLASYLGDFLTQFFYLRGGGALVITAILLLEWSIIAQVLKKFRIGNTAMLFALYPVIIECILYCKLGHTVSDTVSMIVALCFFLGYTKINKKWIAIATGMFMLPLIYILAGGRLSLFIILVAIYDANRGRKLWGYWMLLLISVLSLPAIFRSFYLLTYDQASFIPYQEKGDFLPAVVLSFGALILQIRWFRTLRLNIRTVFVTGTLITLILIAGLYNQADLSREKILALSSETYLENWNRVDRLVDSNKLPHTSATYFTNIALSRRNELPDRLLSYYQPATRGLFLPVQPGSSPLTIFFSNEVFFHLGDMNMAQHSAMLGMTFSPQSRSSRMVKRLAEINLVNGDTTAARKYLRMLDATLFHRRWAASREAMLTNKDPEAYPWLKEKREQIATHDTLRASADYLTSLNLLVESNPKNKAALDYLLCYHLLNKDIRSFKTAFDTYCKGKTIRLPRLYSEALLIELASAKAPEQEVQSYGIPGDVLTDFIDYTRIYETSNGLAAPLQERFASGYWFYFHFAKMKPS